MSERTLDISACTQHLTDPRKSKNQKYSLESLLLIVFSSAISGYDTPDMMVQFAKHKFDWLNKYVDLPAVPCAETIRFLIACLKPDQLVKGFQAFIDKSAIEGDVISIDGKTMRGTRKNGNPGLHVVSAWSQKQGITLAALESKGKSNEIKTIPDVIEMIDVKGATITTDAMGCQKDIAAKIHISGGDYALQLKDNQATLLEEIKAYHHKLERDGYGEIEQQQYQEIDKGHGRLEIRNYEHFELSNWVSKAADWAGVKSVIRVTRTRETKEDSSTETAWYLSSLKIDANHAARAIRGHWECENKLHWRLDVVFKEDECQQRTGAVTIAVIKRFCMNLLKINDNSKRRMKHRVMAAAIDDDYRSQILFSG